MIEIKDRHTLRERMPIGLVNAMNMLRDWSMDRFPNQGKQAEKPFYDASNFTKLSWILDYNFFFKSKNNKKSAPI